ncbi:TetR/AcrR family transcriptional regulator [Chitinophaga polysaccharea]|uniref:TetR/AcrR family transcriptional regulator n=1 Tax=Chitinophaga polysaccharea TaxID=1293035 RepID=UPI001455D213|nr:TetR/AcrR family transcriptional regulator [Chitinophaga polysaccharea]NLR57353.1 TetR/AcrR family transcriptional regulator [Chitinophaga polysaccharea]
MARPGNPKEKILATAARLFYEQGYNATGINQVLEEAGVAKASLYSHFGSKDELGLAYLKAARQDWFQAVTAVVDAKTAPLDRLLAPFDFLETQLPRQDFRGCRFINMLAEIGNSHKEMQQQVAEHKRKLRRYLHQLLLAIPGVEGHPAADTWADTIYLLFEGAIVETKVFRDIWPVKAAKKTIKHLLSKQ